MGRIKAFSALLLVSLLASCSLIESNEDTHSSSSSTIESSSSQSTEISSESSSNTKNSQVLDDFSDEEIEYARVWLNFGNNKDVDNLKVTLIPAGSLVNPNNVNYGVYEEDVIEIRGPKETDGNIVYSVTKEDSGYINIYSVPYNFETGESQEGSNYSNLNDNTKSVYVEPEDDQAITQLIDLLDISERDSFITMEEAINLYEKGIQATSDGEISGLESEFYSRDYFSIAQDNPDYLMLSFENQGRGGQDYYIFKGEDGKIKIDTYFEDYNKDTPDTQWTYDIETQTFTENSKKDTIDPFTEETAFEYIKKQEGFDDDIAVEFSEIQDDGSIELTLASKKMKKAGGSATIDTFVIYPNGEYYSKNNKEVI